MIIRVLSLALAGLFFVAGVGKLFILDSFAGTIQTMTPGSAASGLCLAIGIIGIEILGAGALFANYKTRMVSLLFCCLLTVFLWFLSAAILQGRETPCNCFGVAGIGLSNRQEFLLDLVLFNAFAVLAYASRNTVKPFGAMEQRRGFLSLPVFVAVLLFLEASLAFSVLTGGKAFRQLHPEPAIGFAEGADSRFAEWAEGTRALLLMSYSDLSCPLCFDDFMALADSLKGGLQGKDRHRAAVLFRQDEFVRSDSSAHLARWIAANELCVPAHVAPDSIFEAMGFGKSMVVVVDGNGDPLLAEIFPMGMTRRKEVLRLLKATGKSK